MMAELWTMVPGAAWSTACNRHPDDVASERWGGGVRAGGGGHGRVPARRVRAGLADILRLERRMSAPPAGGGERAAGAASLGAVRGRTAGRHRVPAAGGPAGDRAVTALLGRSGRTRAPPGD